MGCSGWEALALGKPLVHSFRFKLGRFEELYGYSEPLLLKANSAIDVIGATKALLLDEKMTDGIGQASAEWFNKYNGASLAKTWAALIS